MKIVLPSAYFGPVSYYAKMMEADEVKIEATEHYVKQTCRNRCQIATSNKVMDLIVPIARPSEKVAMRDIKIAYQQDWQKVHWNAIESAYNVSPYFEYFAEDLEPYFKRQETYLLDLNMKLQETVLELMQMKKETSLTTEYEKEIVDGTDLRNSFSPKDEKKQMKPYYQVFNSRFGFQTDLSILDLLFNEGPESIKYMHEAKPGEKGNWN